ncbi:MAG: efflux RND transporter periplasmic adaptor subunit [Bacteroidales bacterium]|nr:efflux RND transporter periplasmic adaptor subunit [Bacteroidales bacterium]
MKNLFYFLSLIILISCSPKDTNNVNDIAEDSSKTLENISFSNKQIELAKIETANLEKRIISETIECSGTIEVLPGNIATISPFINGFIKTLYYFPGDRVEKGTKLASLQHPDFINLQQQYIEAKSQVDYYKEEYKRQGELTIENAASIKKTQKAKADYLSYESSYKSLKAQLEILGVNTQEIEKGNFVKEFILISPISGTVSHLNANTGAFVSPENYIYEIMNDVDLNLCLSIFEKDLFQIKVGQKIIFWSLNNNHKREAKVKRKGIKIDNINHTTLIYSKIKNESQQLKSGMFVNAQIYINEHEALTLPSEAIVDYNNESIIFVKNAEDFSFVKVKKGVEQDGIVEILEAKDNLLNSEIVIKGVYYLISKLDTKE